MKALTEQLMSLLSSPELRYETLSALCELARLGDKRLQGACAALAHRETDPLTKAVLVAAAKTHTRKKKRRWKIKMERTLNLLDQLEALLLDMELSLPLRRDLSPPERMRREVLIEGTRAWVTWAREERDHQTLMTLVEASKRLGDLVLTSPEGWYNEGVGQLLRDLEGLGDDLRLEVPRLMIEELLKASSYPALLRALRLGVEGAEELLGEMWCHERLIGRVGVELLDVVAYVGGRVVWCEEQQVRGVNIEMVYCPPGEFWMGSQSETAHDRERPRHLVRLTRGFWIGQTPVTQAQWEQVMGSNPSEFQGETRPVDNVSWLDCVHFCNKLSELAGLERVYDFPYDPLHPVRNLNASGYRMPTEAEWEYAAKAGTELLYAGSADLREVGWFGGSGGGEPWGNVTNCQTQEVGLKKPNAWGIYDMSGNVWEWCCDSVGEEVWVSWMRWDYRHRIDAIDPIEICSFEEDHIVRGGSYQSSRYACRVTHRDHNYARRACGLRLVRTVEPLSFQPKPLSFQQSEDDGALFRQRLSLQLGERAGGGEVRSPHSGPQARSPT